MTSTNKKWFIGCGIGCGLFLLVSAGIGVFGFMAVKKVVNRADNIKASYSMVEETFGAPEEFVPRPDGSLTPSRVEVFLETRRTMAPAREKLSHILTVLQGEMEGFESSGASKIDLMKSGLGLVPAMFDFMESRNLALLEEGMGAGEYKYIYSLAYFGLLEKDPGDGPALTLTDSEDDDDSDHNGFKFRMGTSSQEEGLSREDRALKVRKKLHEVLAPVLDNQMAALLSSGVAEDDPVAVSLAVEIGAMESETYRLIWEESLPSQIRSSLELFADELDELYDPIVNSVEIAGSGAD